MDRKTNLLPLIAAFKILKACMLFTVAFGFHHLWHGDSQQILSDWIRDLRIDPDDKYIHMAVAKILGLPAQRLHELGIFTFFYGVLFATEGFGLLLKKRWAEYMTVVTTVTFLPLEVYELIFTPHRKWLKAILLVINITILIYLVQLLRRKRKQEASATTAVVASE